MVSEHLHCKTFELKWLGSGIFVKLFARCFVVLMERRRRPDSGNVLLLMTTATLLFVLITAVSSSHRSTEIPLTQTSSTSFLTSVGRTMPLSTLKMTHGAMGQPECRQIRQHSILQTLPTQRMPHWVLFIRLPPPLGMLLWSVLKIILPLNF